MSFSTFSNGDKTDITLEPINNVYVPLKTDENSRFATGLSINSNEGTRVFDIKNFKKIDQKTEPIRKRHLVLNDNIFSRVFVGGISVFGIYILYNLLYKKGGKSSR